MVWGIDQQVADAMVSKFPHVEKVGGWNSALRAVGFQNKAGDIVGGIVMTRFDGNDATLSIWSGDSRFLTRDNITALFGWCFQHKGLNRLSVQVQGSNKRSQKLVKGLGFVQEGTIRGGWDDGTDDKHLYGMLRHECKWLMKGQENG